MIFVQYMATYKCPQISHLAGSATANVLGTEWEPSLTEHCLRERRLKRQTPSSLSKDDSSPIPSSVQEDLDGTTQTPVSTELSEQTPSNYSELSPSNTRSFKTIRSFGWRSSSERRLTWTASSFYRMVPRSALPPHSVVRRRTSSLATQSNAASWVTWDTTVKPVVVPSSPTSEWFAKTPLLLH